MIHQGIVNPDRELIKRFVNQIYDIPYDNTKLWGTKIRDFFTTNIIVPYLAVSTKEEIDEEINSIIINDLKKHYLSFVNSNLVIFNEDEVYKSLIMIKESLDNGADIVEFLKNLVFINFNYRRMFCKVVDSEDSHFNDFTCGIKIQNAKFYDSKTEEVNFNRKYFFILPDDKLVYSFDNYCNLVDKEILKEIRAKKVNNKKIKKRNPLDSRLRHECFKRDNYTCVECGASNKEKLLHCDHITPVSQGGTDELNNLQTLCIDCNLAKSNKKWVGGNN